MRSKSFAIAVLIAFAACLYLGIHIHSSRWTMAADEAVHAIDGFRLYDDLHHGRFGDFVAHTYLTERWHPPVNMHLRWYPFVHSWFQAASFLALGPSDFSARLPSVLCLFGSCLLFYAIAWRLAPQHRGLSGVLAVVLLLTAPNVVSFLPSGLVESAVFFMCYLALLVYIRFLEKPESAGRAALAGAAVAAAVMTKYEHGGMLAMSVAISETVRAGFRPMRLLRSRALVLFGVLGLLLAAWFADPEKITALRDASAHPFVGSFYTELLQDVSSWFLEYSSGPVIGALMIASFFAAFPYLRKQGIRALWIFASFGCGFVILKGRFRSRENIVEACGFVLLSATLLPAWIAALSERMRTLRRAWAGAALAAGGAGLVAGIYLVARPDSLFEWSTKAFYWAYNHNTRHLGLKLGPERYIDYFSTLRGAFEDVEWAVLLVAAALFIVGLALARRTAIPAALAAALAVNLIPGGVRLWARAPQLVDEELSGFPALHEIFDFVDRNVPRKVDIVLGGAWNNLANNSLRWYLLTGYGPKNYSDVHVLGATIGSIVLPPGPRVAYLAARLAQAPPAQLPGAIVLIDPTEQFRYSVDFDQDSAVYRRVLAARDVYRLAAARTFPDAGCAVQIYLVKSDSKAPPVNVATEMPPPVPVGQHGWVEGGEDPWRHYWNPMLYPYAIASR